MKLHNLINEKLTFQNNENSILLEEKRNIFADTLQNVGISELPQNIFVVNLDKIIEDQHKTFQYFNDLLNKSANFINKSCDGVIINYENNNIDLVFYELKSKDLTAINYETQLVNTKIFFDYLFTLYNFFYNKDAKIRKLKFVLFYLNKNRPLNMPKSLRQKVEIINIPNKNIDKMINYPTFEIMEYPCTKSKFEYIKWSEIIN